MQWVHALESATSRRDLQCLTLLPFRNVLPEHLFRRRRAWCAVCFDQWRATGQTVYEPLLWAIAAASYCAIHARPLDDTCHHCAGTLSPLGVSPARDTANAVTPSWVCQRLTVIRHILALRISAARFGRRDRWEIFWRCSLIWMRWSLGSRPA